MKCSMGHVTENYFRGLETPWLGQEVGVGVGRGQVNQENYPAPPKFSLLKAQHTRFLYDWQGMREWYGHGP